MNKSKSDENEKVFNHKLVIFDILAYNGDYLVGSTFSERVELLDKIYGVVNSEKDYLFSVTDNIYRVKSYNDDFSNIFNKFIEVDMLEGLVMKRSNAKLEAGLTESNNIKSQIKCRKRCKSYKY
jgi:ATP-dependent DNA ligase